MPGEGRTNVLLFFPSKINNMEEEVKTKPGKLSDHFESLADHVQDYVRTYVELAKARATEKAVNAVSGVVNAVLLSILALFAFMLIGFGLAWWLGDLLNSRAGGFFAAAGIYILLAVVLVVFRKKLVYPLIGKQIIRKVYD